MSKARHLRFNCMWGMLEGQVNPGHPVEVMKKLGINYQHATPQSMVDQWWFWNCENIPNPLPPYLSFANWDPMGMIGFGLSEEEAKKIRDYKK